MNIPRLLYEDSVWVFLLLTVVLGGSAAWATGRAIAGTWRPWWQAALYALVLAVAVRFFHYALFQGSFDSKHYYAVDALVCLTLALTAYRLTRAGQMAAQYAWINEKSGPFGWRIRSANEQVKSPQSR
ncbi:hypothetical protein GJW-30_1_02615 [Variibacter gotjawalensis]|uniref:DUF6867 domain-containing protein n=1 Tax=Variibacter gotjawalensis TaxID=1333996 RepID=A0A0S3PWB3_9BRAD|nr:hypothetical protein [Variibacter gotjawalensis]NIK45906.1 hypothetical protein [Variibacter gotjawalensis]RZS47826.1 hypothetical protein EV661_0219 [Variibacter gotjawalensis]BAT60080.1 hypothetical protein GJW-30_1_02615 [Variibacter gotjawalensis]